ncbi:hypothetical protein [Epibacterium sp. Ofav1-8]|uniref:hypothetical protein n=1 Tax=Epibacterium sp. Ofav1-8 TaxID=2917735 RepID=UPI001EF75174|nr:hypothetical protein [Epibacterium sp. Ofav1-8]MCG7625187.1 hypothetical protein [Epibacterium sp. Ofav1-8]
MRTKTNLSASATLAYGGVLINTMPIWLVRLGDKATADETLPGILATVILLATAAGCAVGKVILARSLAAIAAALALIGLTVLAVVVDNMSQHTLVVAGGGFGIVLGLLLRKTLVIMLQTHDPPRLVAEGVSVGVLASAVVLLADSIQGGGMLSFIAGLSIVPLCLAMARGRGLHAHTEVRYALERPWQHASFLVFFLGMGAYWAFLEAYAEYIGLGSIGDWLLAGLMTSAMGAALASRLRSSIHRRMMLLSLLATAFSGGITYLATTPLTVGISICANGFFLFMFFPLYLGTGRADQAGPRLVVYLSGFALGGALGALAVVWGDFPGLAVVVAASGIMAAPAVLRSPPHEVV